MYTTNSCRRPSQPTAAGDLHNPQLQAMYAAHNCSRHAQPQLQAIYTTHCCRRRSQTTAAGDFHNPHLQATNTAYSCRRRSQPTSAGDVHSPQATYTARSCSRHPQPTAAGDIHNHSRRRHTQPTAAGDVHCSQLRATHKYFYQGFHFKRFMLLCCQSLVIHNSLAPKFNLCRHFLYLSTV
jgi:hypothetical protein